MGGMVCVRWVGGWLGVEGGVVTAAREVWEQMERNPGVVKWWWNRSTSEDERG